MTYATPRMADQNRQQQQQRPLQRQVTFIERIPGWWAGPFQPLALYPLS